MDMSPDELVRDLKAVITDTEDLLKATADQGAEQVAQMRARAEVSLRAVRERIRDLPEVIETPRRPQHELQDHSCPCQ